MTTKMGRAVAGLLLAAGSVVVGAAPAAAGGSWLYPVRDRYEFGQVATLVGYVGRGTQGWLDDGPYYGYLHDFATAPGAPSERGEPLGRLTIEETGASGWAALRVSLNVRITPDLAPGHYQVGYCNDPCLGGLGDLVGSRPLNVAVDPIEPAPREWPLGEPMIQYLDPATLVSGPGYLAPAADIWAGRVVAAPTVPPPVPLPDGTGLASVAVTPLPVPPVAVTPPPVAAPPPRAVAAPPVPDATSPSDDGSPVLVVLGVALAAACTGGVLRALQQDGRTAPLAARPA